MSQEMQDAEIETPESATTAGIDLEELAQQVFELLLQELEIENNRTGNQ